MDGLGLDGSLGGVKYRAPTVLIIIACYNILIINLICHNILIMIYDILMLQRIIQFTLGGLYREQSRSYQDLVMSAASTPPRVAK